MESVTALRVVTRYGPINNIVLLGGGVTLRQLCLWAMSEGTPIKVVTAPRHAAESSDGQTLANFLACKNLTHLVVDDIREPSVRNFLGDTTRSFSLSLGAAWILSQQTIANCFASGLFNLHGTRLPQNRGGGGFSWQILMGNRFGFCAMHRVDGGLDTGDIVAVEEFLYPSSCRIPLDFQTIYQRKSFDFIVKFIERYRTDGQTLASLPQPEYLSSYWPRLITDLNGWIDWSAEASELERFICAFDDPYAGARTTVDGGQVRLKRVCLNYQDGHFHSYQSGLIYRKANSWLCVATKGAGLIVERVVDEDDYDVLNKVRIGDRFVTPWAKLDEAKQRAVIRPTGTGLVTLPRKT
jgi:methionyl-tRNA formyltransferase